MSAEALRRHDASRRTEDCSSPCNAPFTNMYFSATGRVAPCWIQIGTGHDHWRPDRSILDIWHGETFSRLREELRRSTFPGACARCADDIEAGTTPLASVYDAAAPLTGQPQSLELELSNLCNLECVMCHGELSSRIRHRREHRPPLRVPYDEHFLDHLTEVLPGLHRLRFSGGEPLLHDLVHAAAHLVAARRPDLRIDVSTNGTIASPRVWQLLERSYVQLNVSFDSLDERRYEAIRVGSSFSTLMDNLAAFRRHFDRNPGLLTVNVNPMRMNWQEMPDFVRWCDDREIFLSFNEVIAPADLSLRTLPPAELWEVHAALADAATSLGPSFPDPHHRHNHEQYRQLIQRIRTWAEASEGEAAEGERAERSLAPVPVPMPYRRTPSEPRVRTAGTGVPAGTGPPCRAPFTSLFLDQHGTVRPCCQSTFDLGSVRTDRLVDIWTGDRAMRLRDAMSRGDLTLGCQECAVHLDAGRRELAFARRFDHHPLNDPVPGPVQLEVALSNTCNLECLMCNGDASSTIRAKRERRPPLPVVYGDEFFDDLEGILPGLRQVEFFGGEPFLGREPRRLMERLARLEQPIEVRVTTNGTVWNERVRELVRRLRISLVVSVDGASPETFERVRRGARWSDVRANLGDMRELTRQTGAMFALAYCLMPQNWREFADVLRLGESLGAPVWVNTVTAPRFASPLRMDRGDLEALVHALEGQEVALTDLGEPWRATWDAELRRLRDAIESAPPPLIDVAPTTPQRRIVACQLDRNLVPFDVDVTRDDPTLPPVDIDGLLARGTSWLRASRCRTASPHSSSREVERLGARGELIERRTVTHDIDHPGREVITLTVEHWLDEGGEGDEAALRADLVERSCSGSIAEIELDDSSVVTGLRSEPDPLGRLGLELHLGDVCRSPLDALAPRHRDDHPIVEEAPVDASTRRIVVRCASGYELHAYARSRFDAGGLRILATVAAEPEGARNNCLPGLDA